MGSLTTSIAAFVFVLAAIPAALWMLRRVGPLRMRQPGPMRLVGALDIGPRERVTLVLVADRCLVLGQTAQSINLLAELPASEVEHAVSATPGTPSAATAFAPSLLAALGRARDHAQQAR